MNLREQYIKTVNLATPVVISQMGQVVVQLADNAMVGRLGATPLAGVSFAGSVFVIMFIFCIGLSLGLTPLVGEQYARSNHKEAAAYLQNSVVLYMVFAVIVFLVLQLIIPFMPYMGQDEEVVAIAIPYIHYLMWGLVPFMLFAALKQFLEGVGNTAVAMYIVLIANCINIVLNYMFIYGNWGAPAMGASGAGLATLISRCAMPVMLLIYFINHKKYGRYLQFFSNKNFSWRYISSLIKIGFPISMQMLMEVSAFALSAIMVGWIGVKELAASQITQTMSSTVFLILVGLASATTIRVSHYFGAKDFKGIEVVAHVSYRIALVYNLVIAACFILLRNYIPLIFNNDPAVVEIAGNLLIFAAIFQVCDGMQIISLGILRGMKDVRYPMWVAIFSYLIINLPLGYFLAFTLGMGAPGIWLAFVFGLGFAAVLLNRRYRVMMRRGQGA